MKMFFLKQIVLLLILPIVFGSAQAETNMTRVNIGRADITLDTLAKEWGVTVDDIIDTNPDGFFNGLSNDTPLIGTGSFQYKTTISVDIPSASSSQTLTQ